MSIRSLNKAIYGLDRCAKNADALVSECAQAVHEREYEKADAIAKGKVLHFMMAGREGGLLWRWLEE